MEEEGTHSLTLVEYRNWTKADSVNRTNDVILTPRDSTEDRPFSSFDADIALDMLMEGMEYPVQTYSQTGGGWVYPVSAGVEIVATPNDESQLLGIVFQSMHHDVMAREDTSYLTP
ncbi:hypothetical protein M407DRAFT_7002 [Tulasnella calospora MUT 4182]|uniref:Uncharacterized protein n=1 Tax=Tulasnella calospora MUT 4182 TaxID=1051891 RepID=A0A0C3M2R2_9AGAM|nr:hypothetical protein M407DRAFT_7002 [Tulasnella calospora MUT 4182]